MKNKPLWTAIGFIFIAAGFLSIILSLVGLEWIPIQFIYSFGGLITIIFQFMLIMIGFVVIFVARNPPE